ncbi:MAG: hypothetical protein KDA59_26470 [Planctomycetales bacterium]|nr:hypothetical protein [Planctomycetales bacterium]
MVNEHQWDQVINRLAVGTEQGQIDWETLPSGARENVVGHVYRAHVLNKTLVCYEYEYDEYGSVSATEPPTDVAVEFVDPNTNKCTWRVPSTPSSRELIEAVRYRAAGAEEFLRTFLAS